MIHPVVVKCGGSVIDRLAEPFFHYLRNMQKNGKAPVIVHGGGTEIGNVLKKFSISSKFVDGLRVTDEAVMDVVEMVLCGRMNKFLVRQLRRAGLAACGLSGMDGELISAAPLNFQKYGYVGKVVDVRTYWIDDLLQNGAVPVIAPVAGDNQGGRWNVNADHAAQAVAEALGAQTLIFLSDVPGILKDGESISAVDENEARRLIESGIVSGGMAVKLQSALQSLRGKITEVSIVDGTMPASGTKVVKQREKGAKTDEQTVSHLR